MTDILANLISRYRSYGKDLFFDRALYKNYNTKIEVGCKKCGKYHWVSPESLAQGIAGCPSCSAKETAILKKERTKRKVENIIKQLEDKFEWVGGEINGTESSIELKCKNCGHISKRRVGNLKISSVCSNCCCRKTKEDFIKQSIKKYGNRFLYDKVIYKNAVTPVILGCSKCNRYFNIEPNWHLYSGNCPYCSNGGYSTMAEEFIEGIQKLLPKKKITSHLNGKEKYIISGNKKFRVDAYLENNIIIEFYGDYFHGNPALYKAEDVNKLLNKTFGTLYKETLEREEILRGLGYKVIVVWEKDYLNNKNEILRNSMERILSYEN